MTTPAKYPHLTFEKNWELNPKCLLCFGESYSLVKAITHTHILPKDYEDLRQLSLNKGALSTTAIEGNTLSDEHIQKMKEGKKLPESIQYQGIEVKNILDAFNIILNDTVNKNDEQLITQALLLRYHELVGKNLKDHFAAIPGEFRTKNVMVGNYVCPDFNDVPMLVDKYCEFLRNEFKFCSGREQNEDEFINTFIEAIVAHVYLEWIHPFSDGNGRTGRLIEFYILSRAGNPDVVLHILSNHYNNTRPEYYRHLDKASKSGNLSDFIEYAIIGYRDGLVQILEKIQRSQKHITWQKFVYDKFDDVDITGQKEVFKRKRTLALEIPIDVKFSLEEIPNLNIALARLYSNVSEKTLLRDVNELIAMEILKEDEDEIHYYANIATINKMMPIRKNMFKASA